MTELHIQTFIPELMSVIPRKTVVVLCSGNGSNLQALIDASKSEYYPVRIAHVIVNNPNAYAIQRAQREDIPCEIIPHQHYKNRTEFEAEIQRHLDEIQPDFIVLAGFMRVLTDQFVLNNQGKMLNIHPSLLPAYKGLNTHARVIETGDLFHGCTVHAVSPVLDSGKILGQASFVVPIHSTREKLAQRVHTLEHKLLPQVMYDLAVGRLCLDETTT